MGTQYDRANQQYHQQEALKKKKRKRIVVGAVCVILVALLAFVGALGFSALNLKNQASATVATGKALLKSAQSNDSAAIVSNAQKIQSQVTDMRNEVDGPLWTIAGYIPVVGEDISAAQKTIGVADDLSHEILMPIADTLTEYPLNTLYKNGNINGAALTKFCDILAGSSTVIKECAATMDTVGETHIEQVTSIVETMKTGLGTAAQFLSDNGEAIRLVPDLVGCNGTRNYLIVAQNYAEARPTGGLPGTLIPLTVTNGNLDFGENFATAEARKADISIPLTDEELNIFGPSIGNTSTNMNGTPDWPRAANIIAQMWQAYTGNSVDGVIGIDVKTFQDLIALGSDTITLPTGRVMQTSQLTQTLLNKAYMDFTSDKEQNAYFAMVMASALNVLQDKLPDVNLTKLGQTVQKACAENRLMVFMEREDEEALCESLGCAGGLNDDVTAPEVGLYFFDNTWSKMDWYLFADAQVGAPTKNADGTTSYSFTATIRNDITYAIANDAPISVTGVNNGDKRDKSDMVTKVYLYAPYGGTLSNVSTSGDSTLKLEEATHDGHQVFFGQFNLLAQQSQTITATVTVSTEAEQPLQIRMMPLADPEKENAANRRAAEELK